MAGHGSDEPSLECGQAARSASTMPARAIRLSAISSLGLNGRMKCDSENRSPHVDFPTRLSCLPKIAKPPIRASGPPVVC